MRDEISNLYAAAIGEESWDEALDAARALMNADLLMLSAGRLGKAGRGGAWLSGEDSDRLAEAGYSNADRWNPEINPGVATVETMPVGRTFDCRTLVPEEVFTGSDFLQSTVIRHGLAAGRAYVCARDGPVAAGGFVAKRGNREFDPAETTQFDHLIPHIGQALRLRDRLAGERAIAVSLSTALDRIGAAVFLVDESLRVLFANGRAEDLCRRNEGIAIRHNRLTLPVAAEAAALRVLADFDRPDEPPRAGASVAVRAGTAARPASSCGSFPASAGRRSRAPAASRRSRWSSSSTGPARCPPWRTCRSPST